jgi:Ser/Thr protein kinase RdoA (MazF antagonist)
MTTDFYKLTPAEQGERMQVLAQEALKRWDLEGSELTLIKMRENSVFSIDTSGGERYVMRVHRYNYHSDASLYSELQWTAALSASGLDLPPIIPTTTGEPFCTVQSSGVPEPRQVDLSAWVSGKSLADALTDNSDPNATMGALNTIGELAARIHNQATSWQLPKGFVRHAWDAEGLAGREPFWGRFWELPDLTQAQRALMIKARDKVYADLLSYGQSNETYSLIHADLLPDNILIEDKTIRIIDFDDSGFGWHQFELATVLINYLGTDQYETARHALTAGYRRERDLSDEALSFLPLFFLARALTWVGWSFTRYETETAQAIRPIVIALACGLAEDYLSSSSIKP